MGRKKRTQAAKKKGGLLIGMRSGVQNAAKKVTGDAAKKNADDRSWMQKHWLDVVIAIVAAGVLLYKFRIIKF